MDRRTVEPALLAVLAIVALGVAAATLPTATESGGSGEGSLIEGSGDGGFLPTPQPRTDPATVPQVLPWLFAALLLLAGIAFLVYLIRNRREALAQMAAIAGVIALLALVFWLASHLDLGTAGLPGWGTSPLADPATGSDDSAARSPSVVLLLIVGGVLLGAVVVLLRGGSLAILDSTSNEDEPSEDAAAVGRAARRAADRIETTADVENEIYRAWLEMTELLDVARPESSTPGEFARAAVEAGMVPDHVGELTRLFEDVRYGGDEPTEPMERRALAILRRIEERYAPEEGQT